MGESTSPADLLAVTLQVRGLNLSLVSWREGDTGLGRLQGERCPRLAMFRLPPALDRTALSTGQDGRYTTGCGCQGLLHHFVNSCPPMYRASMSVPRKHLTASIGDSTIGSPATLKLVLSRTGTPVAMPKAWVRS